MKKTNPKNAANKKLSRLTAPETRAENARLVAEYVHSEPALISRLYCVGCTEKEGGFRRGYTIAVHRSRAYGRLFYCTKCLTPVVNVGPSGVVAFATE